MSHLVALHGGLLEDRNVLLEFVQQPPPLPDQAHELGNGVGSIYPGNRPVHLEVLLELVARHVAGDVLDPEAVVLNRARAEIRLECEPPCLDDKEEAEAKEEDAR